MGSKISKSKKNSVSAIDAENNSSCSLEDNSNLNMNEDDNKIDKAKAKTNELKNDLVVKEIDDLNASRDETSILKNVQNINENHADHLLEEVSNEVSSNHPNETIDLDKNDNNSNLDNKENNNSVKPLIPILVNNNYNSSNNSNLNKQINALRGKSMIASTKLQSKTIQQPDVIDPTISRMKGVRFSEEVHVINEYEFFDYSNSNRPNGGFFNSETSRIALFFKKSKANSKTNSKTSTIPNDNNSNKNDNNSNLSTSNKTTTNNCDETSMNNEVNRSWNVFRENTFFGNDKKSAIKA